METGNGDVSCVPDFVTVQSRSDSLSFFFFPNWNTFEPLLSDHPTGLHRIATNTRKAPSRDNSLPYPTVLASNQLTFAIRHWQLLE